MANDDWRIPGESAEQRIQRIEKERALKKEEKERFRREEEEALRREREKVPGAIDNGNELSIREMARKRAIERELAKRGIGVAKTQDPKQEEPPEEKPPENERNEREAIQSQNKHTKVLNKKQTVIIWLGLLPIAIELITTSLYQSSWRVELMELLVRSLGILIITALLVFTFRDK